MKEWRRAKGSFGLKEICSRFEKCRQFTDCFNSLPSKVVSAVEKYREVLRNEDEQKGKLKVDSLQIFHAMHNLGKLLEEKHEGVAPTTRDGKLTQQVKHISF